MKGQLPLLRRFFAVQHFPTNHNPKEGKRERSEKVYANANSHTLSLATNNTNTRRELSVVERGGKWQSSCSFVIVWQSSGIAIVCDCMGKKNKCLSHSWTFVLEQEGQSGRGALRLFHYFSPSNNTESILSIPLNESTGESGEGGRNHPV